MAYVDHEVFQGHCRFCLKKHEGNSYVEVIRIIEYHEVKCEKNKDAIRQKDTGTEGSLSSGGAEEDRAR